MLTHESLLKESIFYFAELPWDKPTADCKEYTTWKTSKYMQSTPWSKIHTLALSLIRKILVPTPSSRYTLSKIRSHRWYLENFTKSASTYYIAWHVGFLDIYVFVSWCLSFLLLFYGNYQSARSKYQVRYWMTPALYDLNAQVDSVSRHGTCVVESSAVSSIRKVRM